VSNNSTFSLYIQKQALNSDLEFHSGIRPYRQLDIDMDTVNQVDYGKSIFKNQEFGMTFGNMKSEKKVNFEFYPLFNTSAGVEFNKNYGTKFIYDLGLGLGLRTNFGKKLALEINYRYDLGSFTQAEDSLALNFGVISGSTIDKKQGNHRSSHFFEGYLSYSPIKYFNFRVGYGRHFIGEGYRSLFISDNGSPYPYLNIQTQVWRIKYVNIFAWQKDFQGQLFDGNNSRNKFSSSHY